MRENTFAQAYKRKDGFYSWRLFIDGDVRAKGTNRCDTLEQAIDDFEQVIGHTTEDADEV